jgi:hypothetical protein
VTFAAACGFADAPFAEGAAASAAPASAAID